MKILLKNGEVVLRNKIKKADILISDGKIEKVSSGLTDVADEVIDINGKTVFSGFVDLHTHLREPGFTSKETVASGSAAAVKGGFTDICCMPNTNPIIDNQIVVEYVKSKAKEANKANVHIIGSATKGEQGKEISEIGLMKESGIIAISDDGKPVENSNTMKLCMQYASDFGLKVFSHCEDFALTDGGVVNEGKIATELGLKGICSASEEVAVSREIILSDMLNIPIHLCHISTKGSVQIIRDAKKKGVQVTAETCPHYFSATDELIKGYNTFAKVNPPLRSVEDMQAIKDGIKDGTLDVIATDHAPHTLIEKDQPFDNAPFGISGLETAFQLSNTFLVKDGVVDKIKLNEIMSLKPSEIANLEDHEIKVGNTANITICDTDSERTINVGEFVSKGKNTPFNGWKVFGEVEITIVNGEIKYQKEN